MGSTQQATLNGVRAAWDEYLEATRGQRDPDYSVIEAWAWARLTHRLEQLASSR